MRPALTFMLALLVLAAGVVPTFGAYSVAAKDRHACCKTPTTGCDRTPKPMPCCTIRPAPAPIADVPPSSPRAEMLTQAYLHLSSQILIVFQARGASAVHPHDLSALSEPLRLYRLHSAYLI